MNINEISRRLQVQTCDPQGSGFLDGVYVCEVGAGDGERDSL